jgi:hypothetical protein
MLGNIHGRVALLLVLAACPNIVSQDAHTGADGKEAGAKSIPLIDNEGKDHGIVTYPGGDRVDWKLIELPENKSGTVNLTLSWKPPRPGLQLAFDVFDQSNTEVKQEKKANKRRNKSHSSTASIENAKGKYFVRVYAVDRGDAGAYKLTVDFKEFIPEPPFDWDKLVVANPPKLAEIPEPVGECAPFDPKNKACADQCPDDATPDWKGCKGQPPKPEKCPATPDASIKACWPTMECPAIPDENIKKCTLDHWVDCDRKNASNPTNVRNPKCRLPIHDVTGRIVTNTVNASDITVHVGAGSDQFITKDWNAVVVTNDGKVVPGAKVTILHVNAKDIEATVSGLTPDKLAQNGHIRFSEPPKPTKP